MAKLLKTTVLLAPDPTSTERTRHWIRPRAHLLRRINSATQAEGTVHQKTADSQARLRAESSKLVDSSSHKLTFDIDCHTVLER